MPTRAKTIKEVELPSSLLALVVTPSVSVVVFTTHARSVVNVGSAVSYEPSGQVAVTGVHAGWLVVLLKVWVHAVPSGMQIRSKYSAVNWLGQLAFGVSHGVQNSQAPHDRAVVGVPGTIT